MGLLLAGPALGQDQVRLRTGQVLEGAVLGAGDSRLVFDGPGGVRFFTRDEVESVLDDGQPVPAPFVPGEPDPAAFLRGGDVEGVRVRRRDEELVLANFGAQAVLRVGDLVRTGPQGRIDLLLPGGGLATLRGDALVRLELDGPRLLDRGVVHLRHADGTCSVAFPEGRVVVRRGEAVAERLGRRTRVLCLVGAAEVLTPLGGRLELSRNSAAELEAGDAERPPSVIASNANPWSVRLAFGGRYVSLEPGERALLLGAPPAEEPAPVQARAEPIPSPAPSPRAPEPAPSPEPGPAVVARQVGRVLQSSGGFLLLRPASPVRRVERAEAEDLVLWSGDRIDSDRSQVTLEAGPARLRLFGGAHLELLASGPVARLEGEATLETSGAVALALALGEVGLLRGALSITSEDAALSVALRSGSCGVRLGDAVRAELQPGSELRAGRQGSRLELRAQAGGEPLAVSLGTLDTRLVPGEEPVAYAATGGVQQVTLPRGSQLELAGPVVCRTEPRPEGAARLVVEDEGPDGQRRERRFALVAGSYRFALQGRTVQVVALPAGATTEGAVAPAPAPSPSAAPAPPSDLVERRYPNGAVVAFRGLTPPDGTLVGSDVELAGPTGRVTLAPGARLTLTREPDGGASAQLPDGRLVALEAGAPPFALRVAPDGGLRVEVGRGPGARTLDVEAGCEFDLLVRSTSARAFVFGQVKFVEAGEAVSVSQRGGLRTHLTGGR